MTPDELHAFIIGAAETLCPWKLHYNEIDKLKAKVDKLEKAK